MDDGGEEHSIVYLSKKLLPRQSKYPAIEKGVSGPSVADPEAAALSKWAGVHYTGRPQSIEVATQCAG